MSPVSRVECKNIVLVQDIGPSNFDLNIFFGFLPCVSVPTVYWNVLAYNYVELTCNFSTFLRTPTQMGLVTPSAPKDSITRDTIENHTDPWRDSMPRTEIRLPSRIHNVDTVRY